MADWAYAISQGLGAGAQSGVNSLDAQIKDNMAANAEQRAADIKLDTDQRLLAIQDAMKNRAAERFGQIVRDRLGEQVPVEAPSVKDTGLTDDSSTEVTPTNGAAPYTSSFHGDPTTLLMQMQAVLKSPDATNEQKANAQQVIDGVTAQVKEQKDLNDDSVSGKTRPRTMDEAKDAAIDWALANDPVAYAAGTGMINAAEEPERLDKRLENQAKVAQIRADASERNADRRATATEAAAQIRADALLSKLGGADRAPANVATIQYLMGQGMDFEKARDMVLGTNDGAHKDPVAMAASMASQLIANNAVRLDPKTDPPGTTVASKAMAMAMDQIEAATGRFRPSPAPGVPAPSGSGAKNPAPNNDPLGLFKK